MNISKYFSIAFFLLLLLFQQPSLLSQTCSNAKPLTFTVHLPLVRTPPDEEGQPHWPRPDIWNGEAASADSIVVPNGRPIYALIVSGYASNKYLDEMMLYNFARQLMAKGAYVHYSWWNNLLASYMERPLHSNQSHPGILGIGYLINHFLTPESANSKAQPGEDYQFVADAKKFLTAIRENNPNAIIIVAGHSMGGGAIVHLASQTDELIDILAPIDPVGNRNYPWGHDTRSGEKDYNWTRWRVSRDNFLGYKIFEPQFLPPDCIPINQWLPVWIPVPPLIPPPPLCSRDRIIHSASVITFGNNIVNLFHRYQMEFQFPYDYSEQYHFGHILPLNGSSTQMPVPVKGIIDDDVGGWPVDQSEVSYGTCPPTTIASGWALDGHGEIVGYRGPPILNPPFGPVPLGVKFKTSPLGGEFCPNRTWPSRSESGGVLLNGSGESRRQKLIELESYTVNQPWENAPYNPFLCLVSNGLTTLYFNMNKPPTANAGNNRIIECNGPNGAPVILDGSASEDPDNDALIYSWSGPFEGRDGEITSVTLPIGTHCITLTVIDPSGHIDKHKVSITIQDKIGPVINVSLSESVLWPPNHKLVDINATVSAFDVCGTVESVVLHSIVASEGANVVGSGNTSPDIVGATYNTNDRAFMLRAERSGPNRRRVYTITYKATDNAGNSTMRSVVVVVENPSSN